MSLLPRPPPWLHVVPGILCLSNSREKGNKKWWSWVVKWSWCLGERKRFRNLEVSTTFNNHRAANQQLTISWHFDSGLPFIWKNKNQTQSESKTTFRHFDVWWSFLFFVCSFIYREGECHMCLKHETIFQVHIRLGLPKPCNSGNMINTTMYAKGPELTFIIHCGASV